MDEETGKSHPSGAAVPRGPAVRAHDNRNHPQAGSPVDETTIHTAKAGEDLRSIARQYYGDTAAWMLIFDANRDQLVDPDHIEPGQMLKIPPQP